MFTYKKAPYQIFALGLKFCWAGPAYTNSMPNVSWNQPKKKKKSPESSTNKCLQHTPYISTYCSASQSICCNLSVLSPNFGNMVVVVVQVTKNIGDERGNQ